MSFEVLSAPSLSLHSISEVVQFEPRRSSTVSIAAPEPRVEPSVVATSTFGAVSEIW